MVDLSVRLVMGDCLEELNKTPSDSIDAIITDPPYGINYGAWDTFENMPQVIQQWERILKPDGSLLMFCGWSHAVSIITTFSRESNLKLQDWIIYDRIKGRGAKKRLVSTREDILWFTKGEQWTFNKDLAYSTIVKKTKGMGSKNGRETRALSNVWTDISPIVPWSKERSDHPTQKPLALMERMVNVFTKEGDTVLDSYMGSGTTGVACQRLGRKFIGVEKDVKFYELAKGRVIP